MGGSVRCPAALCGVCGLKPTSGRLPLSGQASDGGLPGVVGIHNSPGLLAKTAGDVARCLEALLSAETVGRVRDDARFVPMPWREKLLGERKLTIGW